MLISYKDIKAAQAKRAKQEAKKEAKGKRKLGRLKRVILKADAATIDKGMRKKRKYTIKEAEEVIVV